MWDKPESALLVLAPEAETLVKDFRDRYDWAASQGVPAHLTLLYPFMAPAEIEAGVLTSIEQLLGRFAPFDYTLAEPRRFPAGVLYLAPEPAAPFKALTAALAAQFPAYPPYGGVYAEVIPHLSVAQVTDLTHLDAIAAEFGAAAAGRLPIPAHAAQVALMDNRSGRWAVTGMFRLGD
ncbi:MAG: 2'-5' RNA ligase family protein [Anaerolineales bacterium]